MPGIVPPEFNSLDDFRNRRHDVLFWRPYLVEILTRHGLNERGVEPVAGHNPTFQTFICGGVVVKLFGYAPETWATSFRCERDALKMVSSNSNLLVPELLAEG
jgi:hygromycin-B 7''-O-kinase